MTDQPDIRPWDRQPGETSKAYEAFKIYLEAGTSRSVRYVSEALSKTQTVIKRWSSAHNWVERSAAWDSMPNRKLEEAYADQARRTAQAHQRLADKLTAKLERNLDLLPDGADPSMRFSTALGAARQSHAFADELSKPREQVQAEITDSIAKLINRLVGED